MDRLHSPSPWRRRLQRLALAAWLAGPLLVGATELSRECPPSFERDAGGRCRLRSLYQTYAPIDGHGGVQAALPAVRDGFTPAQIDLGRYLFFDPVLSADRRSACAHCHHPDHGFADGLPRARGAGAEGAGPERHGGTLLPRRTPGLWNVGFSPRLFWDGRAATLEEQARGPLFSPDEMGNTPEGLSLRLNALDGYRRLFAQAFERPAAQAIGIDEVATALAAFQSSLVSLGSRYDRYAHGDRQALSPRELQGMNVFRGFVARCSQCHTPPLFSNHELAVVGAPPVPGLPLDTGALASTGDPLQRGAFKVPSLRNVTRTGPRYFQAGQLASLREAVAFYNAPRGHALPRGEHQALHWHVHMLKARLADDDVDAIVAFLGALEDESLRPAVPAAVPSGLPVLPTKSSPPAPGARP